MKLAIIGSGPLAIFCAQHFDHLGAEVTLFQKNALGGNARFLSGHFPSMEVTYRNELITLNNFWNEKLVPVITEIENKNLTKAGEVLRVHKRFLHTGEKVNGKSRLHDLFRVIFSVNPKESILKQLEENPEMFKQLGEKVINSLHLPVESFEDFDIVIEARGLGRTPNGMGPSKSMALNENNIKNQAALYYEKNILEQSQQIEKKNLVLVGNGESAALALLKNKDWLLSHRSHTLSWVSPLPCKSLIYNPWISFELDQLLKKAQDNFEKEKDAFDKKMYEWRDLEDYIKAKIPKPIEPESQLIIYEGYDVTSVDRLLDREGVFATIESPDFREYAKVSNDLKTLPAEAIFIANGIDTEETIANGLEIDEPGFYRLAADNLDDGLSQIQYIEDKILAFFSRAP
jgi:hypothetical protein